jgi:hypothetical protein
MYPFLRTILEVVQSSQDDAAGRQYSSTSSSVTITSGSLVSAIFANILTDMDKEDVPEWVQLKAVQAKV